MNAGLEAPKGQLTTNNADKLLYHGNLSPETVEKMKKMRKLAHNLAKGIDNLGAGSAELTLAFRHVQQALFFINAHLCYVDPQAVKEELPE